MAGRLTNCMAYTAPGSGQFCGRPTDQLIQLACERRHFTLVSSCQEHTDLMLASEPDAIQDCALCRDATGDPVPMSIRAVDPYSEDHPILRQITRDRQDLESL